MSSPNVVSLQNHVTKARPRELETTAREFLPAALEILETPASPIGRAIAGVIVGFCVCAIVWAVFGHVDIIAISSGKVVPTGRTKTIQPLEAGTVAAIHVRDGDKVSTGQVLIELDQTTSRADRDHVAHDLLAAQLDVARLTALRENLELKDISFDLIPPKDASQKDIAKARTAMLAQAMEQRAKLGSLEQQVGQKTAELEQVKETISKISESLPLLEEGATIRRKAMDIQFGNRVAYLDAQTRLVDMQHEKVTQERKVVEIIAARQSLEQQKDQATGAYAHQIFNDLFDAERKVNGLKEDLVKADRKLSEQLLRSPIDGTVQQLALHTVGGVVTPAQQLMNIVPIDSQLEVEAMLSNRDIGFVSMGQPAEVKIDTFNFTRYGLLQGNVTSVSQDAIIREKPVGTTGDQKPTGSLSKSSEPDGQELLYSARIALDVTEMQIEGKSIRLVPGMAVTAEIKTGSRRLIEYLMSPLLRYKHESLRER